MNNARTAGVVVDTTVISWLFADQPHPLTDRYRALIGPRPVLLAFQTVMELRYGALRANCGELRRRRLERDIAQVTVVRLMTRWQWSAPISVICVNGSNDSRVPLGANRDRHKNLGEGTIGPRPLRALLGHPDLQHLPAVLEVPGIDCRGPGSQDLAVARALHSGGVAARKRQAGRRSGSLPSEAGRPFP